MDRRGFLGGLAGLAAAVGLGKREKVEEFPWTTGSSVIRFKGVPIVEDQYLPHAEQYLPTGSYRRSTEFDVAATRTYTRLV